MPVIGLVPLVFAVFATQGAFSPRQTPPNVAGAPTGVQATLAPTSAAASTPATAEPAIDTPVAVNPTSGTVASATSGVAATPASGATTSPTSGVAASATSSAAVNPTSGVAASTSGAATATSTSGSTNASAAYVAYKVQPGDTVFFIARAYGVSTASIIQASGLSNPDLLHIGQVLTVPAQPGWLYRVQPGETLDQIASRTGVASDRIASASGLTVASVGAGDVLLIPDQTVAQSK